MRLPLYNAVQTPVLHHPDLRLAALQTPQEVLQAHPVHLQAAAVRAVVPVAVAPAAVAVAAVVVVVVVVVVPVEVITEDN